ncbi:MAG: carbonate dehydratase [Desulfamplus sp.]|nr:carbonate dehydratase [Desulfamplus sp.]
MKTLPQLFDNNQNWVSKIIRSDPQFFQKLSQQQSPKFLWIGCSDSRVPANEIVGLLPGEMFVHRNVANIVIHSDMNCLSVIQYAIEVLKIKHIIVCGHYGCGGVRAAIANCSHGLIDNWLGHIRDIYRIRQKELMQITDDKKRVDRLCELNVMEQVKNVGNTTFVRDAWAKGESIVIHGWIYAISNGLLKDLNFSISSTKELNELEEK